MSKVVLDVSMSLDGFTAGPNVREAEPMGTAANAYTHGWPGPGPTARSISAYAERWTRPLAPRSSDGVRSISASDPWGGTPWPGIPSFVVTHRARQDLLGNNGGMFAFDGLEAVRRAKQTAEHKDVLVLGADVARQLLRAGLLDEVRIHLVPLLLGLEHHCSTGSRPS